jgi:fatty-acyl-CoA synthase
MQLIPRLKRDYIFLRRLFRILARIKDVKQASSHLVCDDFERACDLYAQQTAISLDNKRLTYQQFEALSNRYAHWAKARGLKAGDTVALVLPNRHDYVAIWVGLNKVGVRSALINNSLTGQGLAHCINVSGASISVVDTSTLEAFQAIEGQVIRHQALWCLDIGRNDETSKCRALEPALQGVSSVRPERATRDGILAHKTALYIYTSGTTGLPKAAKISNARAQLYMKAFAGVTTMKPGEKLYCVLPLYHATAGLCAVGAAMLNGGELVLKKRFSASQFWGDVRRENCSYIVYIGELCRYLINSPPAAHLDDERGHAVKMMFGNGMRPEVWEPSQKRFNIKIIVEFYRSTEGNVSLFNLDGKAGAIGRIPSLLKGRFNVRLVRFDVATELPMRGADGLCIECKPGEVGEALGQIGHDARESYSGYADKVASQKKILSDVFRKGDQWFRTGDLMRLDREGYFYFVDRVGDTFRFKGENVSTSEVSEYAASAPHVVEAIAYGVGVPHHDGKAGMVALIVNEGFALEAFKTHMEYRLPSYARPRFVRILKEVETTGTFKYKKMDLVKDGVDVAKIKDDIYVLIGDETYMRLTPELLKELSDGQLRL